MRNSGEGQVGVSPESFSDYDARTSGGAAPQGNAGSVLEDARTQLSGAWDRLDLRSQVEQHPFRTLGIALGAGYVLGGGLFTKLTGRLLFGGIRMGMRLAALPVLRDEIMGLANTISPRGRGSV